VINKISLFFLITIILSKGVGAEFNLHNHDINDRCHYTPSSPDSHFGAWDNVYKLHFKKDIPLRLTLVEPRSVYRSNFYVYFQNGAFNSGDVEPNQSLFDPLKPYCAIRYIHGASFNEQPVSEKSKNYRALESQIKAGTSIEFEHDAIDFTDMRNDIKIVPRVDLINYGRLYSFSDEVNRKESGNFNHKPKLGDGVYAISCSSAFSGSDGGTITIGMVLNSFPKDSLVIEERNFYPPECD